MAVKKQPLVRQRSADAIWQAPALMWILLGGEGLAGVLALGHAHADDRWIYFGLASLVVQWISMLALVCLYLARRRLYGLRPLHLAYIALALLLVCAWLVGGVMWWLLRESLQTEEPWPQLLLRFSGIVIVVGLLGIAAFHNHWRARQLAVRTKQAELEALQARIRPHFLFNALNSGVVLVRQHPEQAERLLMDLADLFRAALAGPRETTLAEELDLTRRYLDIEAIRFGPRLQMVWRLAQPVPSAKVPTLSIQPLAENAVRHGIERLPAGGRIDIAVEVQDNTAVVTIHNDAPTHSDDARPGHSIGLSATRARIAEVTSGRGGLQVMQTDGRYTAIATFPLDKS